ncbi:roadblock/LC7 domain-containing protein [Streptomyces sp. NPDC001037]|uniref:roadblock/LC7 domain-containing protein n=1 Tax=Streptomyces sp. NPDC001037 TaxID=3364542 RepID=UPI0036869C20
MTNIHSDELGRVLRDFVERMPHAYAAVVSSTDGLHKQSFGLSHPDHESKLSAVTSSMFSLGKGADQFFNAGTGTTRQVIYELDGGLMFVTEAASHTLLSVLASHEANLGLIGYEMKMLGQQVGRFLATAPRTASAS